MTFVQQSLSLFATHHTVCIAEDEADGSEEVTLPRTIATNNDIGSGGERLDFSLVLITTKSQNISKLINAHLPLEALDNNLLDVHLAFVAPEGCALLIDVVLGG